MSCIVKKNGQNNLITSIVIKNYNNPTVIAVERNNGNELEFAPNGEPSILYNALISDFNMSPENAKKMVAYTYSDEFGEFFGRWWEDSSNSSVVVDNNKQPRIVWQGLTDSIPEGRMFQGYEIYGNEYDNFNKTGNVEDYRFSNSAIFVENKSLGENYAASQMTKDGRPAGRLLAGFLNIRKMQDAPLTKISPIITEEGQILREVSMISPKMIPIIDESIQEGYDGFTGSVVGDPTRSQAWMIKNESQVLPIEMDDTETSENEIIAKENEETSSQLFEELRSLPFITEEQALEIYKETHSDKMNFWKDSNLNCK